MTASDEDAVVVDAAAPEEDGAAEAAVPESDAAAAAPSASPSAAPGAYQVAALSDSESEGAAGAHAAAVADSDEEAEAGKKRRRRGHELDEEDYDLLEQNNVVGVRRPAEQPRKRKSRWEPVDEVRVAPVRPMSCQRWRLLCAGGSGLLVCAAHATHSRACSSRSASQRELLRRGSGVWACVGCAS